MAQKRRISKPIFVHGFSRGGSNLLMNLLLSHPDVCMPSGETQNVFRGKALGDSVTNTLRKQLFNKLPVCLLSMRENNAGRIFSPANYKKRGLSDRSRDWIDRVLYQERILARHEGHNLWKAPDTEYSKAELKASRLVCKNLNGIQYIGDIFRDMYPDAVFLCLVRHPLALAESRLRRGQTIDRVVDQLLIIGEKMMSDSRQYSNYHLIKFEDMLSAPRGFLTNLYKTVDLNLSDVNHIRFQNKTSAMRNDSRDLKGEDRSIRWYPINDFEQHFHVDINDTQIASIPAETRQLLETKLAPLINAFGYEALEPIKKNRGSEIEQPVKKQVTLT